MFIFYILEDIIFKLDHWKSLQIEEDTTCFLRNSFISKIEVSRKARISLFFNTLNYCQKRDFFY